MSTFEDRENAFESKYAHDAEMQFKAEARRNRLLGLWAAGLLGKHGDDALAYAKEVVRADFEEAGEEDVFRKLKADLAGRVEDVAIRRQMETLLSEAKVQIIGDDD